MSHMTVGQLTPDLVMTLKMRSTYCRRFSCKGGAQCRLLPTPLGGRAPRPPGGARAGLGPQSSKDRLPVAGQEQRVASTVTHATSQGRGWREHAASPTSTDSLEAAPAAM